MPHFAEAFLDYIFRSHFPTQEPPEDLVGALHFTERVYVHHSAVCRFFAPSDTCGYQGMQRQTVRCNPKWKQKGRHDTVFVSESDAPGMDGMLIAQLRLLFSFHDPEERGQSEEKPSGNYSVAPSPYPPYLPVLV